MDEQKRSILEQIRGFLEKDNALKSYFGGTSSMSPSRFWSLLRSDLMRLRPSEISTYLKNDKTILAEMGDFFSSGNDAQQRQYQDALIRACLEMDAAAKIKSLLPSGGEQNRAKTLNKKLKLWRMP